MKRTNLIVVRIYTQATEVHWKKTDVLSCGRPLKSWLLLVIIILPQDVDREIQKNLFRLQGLVSKQLLRTENREVRRREFIIKSKNLSLPRSRFQGITFRFYPQNAGVKLHPLKKSLRGRLKKAAKSLTFLSKHVPGKQPLPFASVFFATRWWYLNILSLALSCNKDLWFLVDRPIYYSVRENRGWQLLSKARNRTST